MKKFTKKMVEREVLSTILCDRCGGDGSDESPYFTDFKFAWHDGEEDAIVLKADLCYNCADELLIKFIPKLAMVILKQIPNASVYSPLMLEMVTGEFDESQDND